MFFPSSKTLVQSTPLQRSAPQVKRSCEATQSRTKRPEEEPQNENGRDAVNCYTNTGIETECLFLSAGYTRHDTYDSPSREQPDYNSCYPPPHINHLPSNG